MALKTVEILKKSPIIRISQLLIKEKYWIQKCRNLSSNYFISPEHVLSQANREKFISLIKSPPLVNLKNGSKMKQAAVLVPMCEVEKKLGFLYIIRAMHLKVNGGEVAFPGGRYDETDVSLEATALRETFEEIGINEKEVDIWGKGPMINRRDVCVTPILGHIKNFDMKALNINPDEVSKVFHVSFEHLVSPENFRETKFQFGKFYTVTTPVYLGAGKRIWGLTAYITHIILSSLLSDIYPKNIKFKSKMQEILSVKKKK